jgi:Flp pilus assembly pilin Flp
MMNFIKNFRKDEDGAVTVDWVVLTAAVVGLAVVAYNTIGDNTETLTRNIATEIGGVSAVREAPTP